MKTEQLLKEATARPLGRLEYHNDTGPGDESFLEWWEVPGFGKFDSQANAELARRAVNSFEAMREALKSIEMISGHATFSCAAGEFDQLCCKCVATKALAIAEGKETK